VSSPAHSSELDVKCAKKALVASAGGPPALPPAPRCHPRPRWPPAPALPPAPRCRQLPRCRLRARARARGCRVEHLARARAALAARLLVAQRAGEQPTVANLVQAEHVVEGATLEPRSRRACRRCGNAPRRQSLRPDWSWFRPRRWPWHSRACRRPPRCELVGFDRAHAERVGHGWCGQARPDRANIATCICRDATNSASLAPEGTMASTESCRRSSRVARARRRGTRQPRAHDRQSGARRDSWPSSSRPPCARWRRTRSSGRSSARARRSAPAVFRGRFERAGAGRAPGLDRDGHEDRAVGHRAALRSVPRCRRRRGQRPFPCRPGPRARARSRRAPGSRDSSPCREQRP